MKEDRKAEWGPIEICTQFPPSCLLLASPKSDNVTAADLLKEAK